MRKYLAALLALGLVAAAFFLPGQLARWGDAGLLDVPHITAEEARESFAEAMQLTCGEKLLLLRDGDLASMDVETRMVQGLYTTPIPGENGVPGSIEHGFVSVSSEDEEAFNASLNYSDSGNVFSEEELLKLEIDTGISLDLQMWDDRVASAWNQVRTLQSLGGLPELWTAGSALEYLVYGDVLYVDSATQVSFQTYRVRFSCSPYDLEMFIDTQSGRVLSFILRWDSVVSLNWGPGGSTSFGSAWRDYWKLDKVSDQWYMPIIKDTLECPPESLNINGSYNNNCQVVFSYDNQSLSAPLINWVYFDKESSLWWNV